MALTDTAVRQAKAKDKPYTIKDIDGLSLFVAASGTKSWHFRFSWHSKQLRISLGTYPELSLRDARLLRDQARSLLARGIDPREHRRVEKEAQANTLTFAQFAQIWKDFKFKKLDAGRPLNEDKKRGRQGSKVTIERYLHKDMLPVLGKLPMKHITRGDVLEVQRRIEARGSYGIAEKVRGWLHELFRYAVVVGEIDINPATDLDVVAMPQRPEKHNPFLKMSEMPELMAAIHNYQGAMQTQLGLRLLLLTGVRTGELRYAEPEQFDLGKALWTIPAEEVKQLQRRVRTSDEIIPPYLVPLPRQAVEIVKTLLSYRFSSQRYLLCHYSEPRVAISENTLNGALRRMGFKDRLTGHGIRATLSTALNELRYDEDYIEAQLSHASKNKIRGTYNHAEYVEQRRQMMQDWADRLDAWETEGLARLGGPER